MKPAKKLSSQEALPELETSSSDLMPRVLSLDKQNTLSLSTPDLECSDYCLSLFDISKGLYYIWMKCNTLPVSL